MGTHLVQIGLGGLHMIPYRDTCSLVLNECNDERFYIYNILISLADIPRRVSMSLDRDIANIQSKLAFLSPWASLSESSVARSLVSLLLSLSSVISLDEQS